MNVELVSINIPVPDVSDEVILEVTAAGVAILIDQHKKLGLSFTDESMQEHARLTIGDHITEIIGEADHDRFAEVYDDVIERLEIILGCFWTMLEEFTTQVDNIHDIMTFWYPGVIRLAVLENPINANQYSQLYVP